MTNVVNLPTYTQVENVKTAVENMETVIANNGGTDWSKYRPFVYVPAIQITEPTDTEYRIACEIIGQGYLNNAYIEGTSLEQYIKITIDGNVLFEGRGATGARGIIQECIINSQGSGGNLGVPSPNAGGVLVIANTKVELSSTLRENSICIVSQPLFFKNSLLVEVKKGTTTSTATLRPFVNGGVLL